jgi:hypothetical protein
MKIVAILFGFASLSAFFAFALAYQQRQTESDCALERAKAPDSKRAWQLCFCFFFLALVSAAVGFVYSLGL